MTLLAAAGLAGNLLEEIASEVTGEELSIDTPVEKLRAVLEAISARDATRQLPDRSTSVP